MRFSRRRFLQLASLAALPTVSPAAWAQAYPSRPIRLVVPFPPGGAFDTLGRPLAERLKRVLGTVIIENIGGGGSSLGASQVAHAAPDGYTVLLGGTLPHVNEALLKSRPLYDPLKDLDPIANVASNTIGIAVHPSVPAKTLAELIAYAKANPGKLSYGHVGIGSTNHLAGEMLKSLTGIDIVEVPYRGAGPATADLLAGQIPMALEAHARRSPASYPCAVRIHPRALLRLDPADGGDRGSDPCARRHALDRLRPHPVRERLSALGFRRPSDGTAAEPRRRCAPHGVLGQRARRLPPGLTTGWID
jgi:hypothetical protein